MDYGIFNVRTDVNACDCAQGVYRHQRESALKVDFGRKSLAALEWQPLFATKFNSTVLIWCIET